MSATTTNNPAKILHRCKIGMVAWRITNKTRHVPNFPNTLKSSEINTDNPVKYFGVTTNNDLSWASHITNVCSAAEKNLWFLRKKLKLAPSSVKLSAYLTIVRPTLEYASIIWDPHHKGLIDKLEKVQKRRLGSYYHVTHALSLSQMCLKFLTCQH